MQPASDCARVRSAKKFANGAGGNRKADDDMMGVPYSAIEQLRKCIGLEECEDLHPRHVFVPSSVTHQFLREPTDLDPALMATPARVTVAARCGPPQYQHQCTLCVSTIVPFVAHSLSFLVSFVALLKFLLAIYLVLGTFVLPTIVVVPPPWVIHGTIADVNTNASMRFSQGCQGYEAALGKPLPGMLADFLLRVPGYDLRKKRRKKEKER